MTRHMEQIMEALREAEQLQSTIAHAVIDPPDASRNASLTGMRIAEARQILESIETLREDEASEVAIFCDNPEGDPNLTVVVTAEWTDWIGRSFNGETLAAALQAACKAKEGAAK